MADYLYPGEALCHVHDVVRWERGQGYECSSPSLTTLTTYIPTLPSDYDERCMNLDLSAAFTMSPKRQPLNNEFISQKNKSFFFKFKTEFSNPFKRVSTTY